MLTEEGLLHLWRRIYRMTSDVTPLPRDCGQLCDAICCTDWAPGVGVYLYPGEQLLIGSEPWLQRKWHDSRRYMFPPSWKKGGWFITCNEACERELRPFGCRTFPLTAHLDERGRLSMVLDENGAGICPLIKTGAAEFLTATFRATMQEAWKLLLCVKPIRDDVLMASEARRRRARARGTDTDRVGGGA